ncbi:hypothetical protein B0H13DRAFT_2278139 [Mycena leptocephala]|nr:hypothetical protein B0H13DRAFT_2278139 [Mycena leptocephala]
MYGSQEVSTRGSRQFHSPILTGTVGAASRALAKVAMKVPKVPKVQKIVLCAKFMPMYRAQEVSTRGSRQFHSPILTGTLGAVSQALAKVVAKVTVAPSRSNQARRVLEVGVQANMFSKMKHKPSRRRTPLRPLRQPKPVAVLEIRITFALGAATNLVFTALTGKSIILIAISNTKRFCQLVGYCGFGVQHHMLVSTHSAVVITRA